MTEGFSAVLDAQERLTDKLDEHFQREVVAALNSSVRDLESARLLDWDTQRGMRIEAILNRISPVCERLCLEAEDRFRKLREGFESTNGRGKLNITSTDLVAMLRVRMACSAAALKARVLAEAGQPPEAARFLAAEVARLRGLLVEVGKAIFAKNGLVYDELLNIFWADRGITPDRIEVWAARFDPEASDLAGVLRRIQQAAKESKPLDKPRPDLQNIKVIWPSFKDGSATRVTTAKDPDLSEAVGFVLTHVLDDVTRKQVIDAINRAYPFTV